MNLNNRNDIENLYNEKSKIDNKLDINKFQLSDKERMKDPIFRSIGYPSKIYYRNIQPFIKAYTKEGALVLDSCSGSGSTGLASLIENRKCILIDNSPHAVNMALNIIKPIDFDQLNTTYKKMIKEIKDEIKDIYFTKSSDGFSGYAEVIISSNVYSCPSCKKEIVLYKNETGKRSEYKCPHCFTLINISVNEIKDNLIDRRRPVEVKIKITDKASPTKYETRDITSEDIIAWESKLEEYELKYKDYWSPNEKIIYNRSYPRVGGWPGFPIDSTVSDLFPKPNLLALKKINNYIDNEIENEDIKFFMKFIFTESLFRTSSRLFVSSGIKNVYHIPPLGKEQNVLTVFQRKYKSIVKAKKFAQEMLPEEKVRDRIKILQGNARDTGLKSNSIDYAFIDPPYGGMVPYAELNLFYSAWLNEKEDIENEIIIPMDYEKKEGYVEKWGKYIEEAFGEVFRVLKPGAFFTVVFHSKFNNIWNELRDIMINRLGFEFINIIENKRGTTFHTNQINDTNPVSAFITYRKPLLNENIIIQEHSINELFERMLEENNIDGKTFRYVQSKIIFLAQEMSLDIPTDKDIEQYLSKNYKLISGVFKKI